MHKNRGFMVLILVALFALCALSSTGCSKVDVDAQNEAIQKAVDEALQEREANEERAAEAKESEALANEEEPVDLGYSVEDDGLFTFASIAGQEFWAISDEGVWNTLLVVSEDGSFEGFFQEADYEETGSKYPNGTVYICDFTGEFRQPIVKLNDYTYLSEVAWLECQYEVGASEIIDGVKYINTVPHGVTEGGNVHIYIPGTPLNMLPEEFVDSVGYTAYLQEAEAFFPSYGLYDVSLDDGFAGYDRASDDMPEMPAVKAANAGSGQEETELSDTPSIDERIASAEKSVGEQDERLNKDNITQSEMNEAAAIIYQTWCDQLDWMLDEMEASLDANTMNSIKAEQREWTAKREKAMKEAGSIAENGSMQPLLEATEGAEMTKNRVYELAGWLR